MGIVDTHIHTIFLSWQDIMEISSNGYEALVTLSFTPYKPRSIDSLMDHFEHMLMESTRIGKFGLNCIVGLGVHPRCLNPKLLEDIPRVLEEYLDKAGALGEVGLEECSDLEVKLLVSQVQVAVKLDKPIVIHTPRRNKAAALRKIVKILENLGVPEELVVIDHMSASNELLDLVENKNYMLGFTIQPGKASVSDVLYIIEERPEFIERVVLNSDAQAENPSNYLAVADALEELEDRGYSREAYRVTSLNAKKLFKW